MMMNDDDDGMMMMMNEWPRLGEGEESRAHCGLSSWSGLTCLRRGLEERPVEQRVEWKHQSALGGDSR